MTFDASADVYDRHVGRYSPALSAALIRVAGVQPPAEQLPFEGDRFDAVLSQLVVNFLTDPQTGVAEMRRVARPGGRGGRLRLGLLGRDDDAARVLGCSPRAGS